MREEPSIHPELSSGPSHTIRAVDGRGRSVSTQAMESGMGNVVAGNGRKWSGGWEGTDRLYGTVGENSIDFLKILYRLFLKTL